MCTYIRGHAGCLETSTRGRDMRSLAPAFVRALAVPLPPLPSISMTSSSAIDTSLLRERERGISIDFFLKMARWQRPSYARTFGPIVRRMLCDPFEMPFDARIPFPSINMEFRAVETLPPPLRVTPAIRSQTSSSSGDNGIFLTISRTPRTLPP